MPKIETPLTLSATEAQIERLNRRDAAGEIIADAALAPLALAALQAQQSCDRVSALAHALDNDRSLTDAARMAKLREHALKAGEQSAKRWTPRKRPRPMSWRNCGRKRRARQSRPARPNHSPPRSGKPCA